MTVADLPAPTATALPGLDTGGHRSGEPGFRRLTVALFLAGVATFTTLYCPQPLLPQLATHFAVSPAAAALTISVATLALALGLVVAGPLSDVIGRTPLMHASLLASGVVGLAVAAAPNWPALLALRAVQGLVLAGLPAVTMAYLREEVHPSAHARATGLYIGGNAIGGMSGRLVAGAVSDAFGWRAAIAVIAVVAVAAAVAVWHLLPPSAHFRRAGAGAAALLATSRRLLRDPVLLGLYGLGATLMGTFVAVYNAVGFRLESAPYRLGPAAAGLVFLVYPLGSLGSTLAGRAADRIGRRTAAPVAAVLMTAGIAVTLARPLPFVVAGIAVLTVGFFATHSLASGWVAARAHLTGGGAGQASALYLLAYYIGGSVFGALAGSAWSAGGWPQVAAMTGALTVVGVGLTLALARTRPPAGVRG